MISLTIYLLCHNRPNDARAAINSIIKQENLDFHLIISDNSSNNDVHELVKTEFPTLTYIRRFPTLPALDHFNYCIAEADSDYFCLFHDDDVLDKSYITYMKFLIAKYPDAIGYACNSHIENSNNQRNGLFFQSYKIEEKIKTPTVLARRYYGRSQSGIAPFSSYIYNKKLLGYQRIPTDLGKYADSIWLFNLLDSGYIVWLNKPLMTYRLHDGNDSNLESRMGRLSVLGHLKKRYSNTEIDIVDDYRCSFIYKKIIKNSKEKSILRMRAAKLFLTYYNWRRYSRLSTYLALARRAMVKLLD